MMIKIKNKNGLFSRGGYTPSFTKKGKVWSSLGYVKNHLNQINEDEVFDIYSDCILVEIDEDELTSKEYPMKDFIDNYILEKKEKDLKRSLNLTKFKIDGIPVKIQGLVEELESLENYYNEIKIELEALK